jgi:hypothetical protein
VSAGNTARSTLAAVGGDRVRALQHALYRAAKADPERRFHVLFDKVHRRDVLDRAWQEVRKPRSVPDGASAIRIRYKITTAAPRRTVTVARPRGTQTDSVHPVQSISENRRKICYSNAVALFGLPR